MPSNNIEIEQAVLGSLLLNVNAYPEVDAKLSAEDFISEVHSDIYKCIKHLAESGKGTDYISVSRELDSCLLYTSPSPRDGLLSRMPSSA